MPMTTTTSRGPMTAPRPLAPSQPAATDASPEPPRPGAGTGRSRAAVWLPAIPAFVLGLLGASWWANWSGTGPDAVLVGIAQLSGLGASVFALVTVVTMSRVPIIVDAVGTDRTLRWHRWSATITMVLLPIHVVTSVLGYAGIDAVGIGEELGSLLTSYPDMLTATAGTVLLTVISLTSIRWLRRRFRYQTWLFIHWYSYLAVALSFGHTLSNGTSFVHESLPTLAWTWLHLVVAGVVLWYRVVAPVGRMVLHPLRVGRVRVDGPGVATLTLTGKDLDEYRARAGQHIRVRFLTLGGWWQSHPFSLSAAPTAHDFRFTVVTNGDHTTWMQSVVPGTRALVSGAYGHLTAELCDRPAVLIGGGSGIAPLRAVLEDLPPDADVRVVHRARSADDLILRHELEALARAHHTHVDVLLGPRAADPATDPLAPEAFLFGIPDLPERVALVCGSAGFVDAVSRSLLAAGVPSERIHTERFDS